MVRQVIYAKSTKSCTAWKCTNKARWSDRSSMLNQQKVTYTLEMHKQGKMVRQVIYAQSTRGHIQSGNAQMRQDGQTDHSCSINKRPHTAWKCTNKVRWSDRFSCSINKGHIQPGNAQPRQHGQTFINAQSTKVTYTLEMHKQGEMVRQVIHAQSTKGHIQSGNAQTR